MPNILLTSAKAAKNDEFYTRYTDIEKEIEAYLDFDPDTFRGKVVYSNCDDPFESNFFRFFALNFNRLGLKQLITTSYKPSPIANTQLGLFGDDKTIFPTKGRPKITANKLVINEVHDMNGDGAFNLTDVAEQLRANKNNEWTPLEGDGDFRSPECIKLLKISDIVVTNPPFSLFRSYTKQLFDYNKKFIVIGNMNAITYKEIFPLIKENQIWAGATNFNTGMYFKVPDNFVYASSYKFDRVRDGENVNRVPGVCWFTNLDHGRRHQPLSLMTMEENLKFNKKMKGKSAYDRYDNYDAIEVPFADAIPSDYSGVMGVPISFLDKYSPEQFEIVGSSESYAGTPPTKKYTQKIRVVDGKRMKSNTGTMSCVIRREEFGAGTYFDVGYPVQAVYKRLFIKHKTGAS